MIEVAMVNWLFDVTLETTVLALLILLLRPIVRRTLGAGSAYLLWSLVPLSLIISALPDAPVFDYGVYHVLPEVPRTGMANGEGMTLILACIWMVGAVGWLGIRLFGYSTLQTDLERTSQQPGNEVSELIAPHMAGYRGAVLTTSNPQAPFAMGLIAPRIYLPENFNEWFTPVQQGWIVRHEKAHHARGDLWVLLIAEIVRALFWFNPLVHICFRIFRADQELACDHALIGRATPQERVEYGETLLRGYSRGNEVLRPTFFNLSLERYKMISKHKASGFKKYLGYGLVGSLAFLSMTTAPVTIAGALDDKPLTLNFQQIQAKRLLDMIGGYVGVRIDGVEQLEELRVDVQVTNVSAREALHRILGCNGYMFEERADSVIEIVVREEGARGCD